MLTLVVLPGVAVIFAMGAVYSFRLSRKRIFLVAAVAWLLYALYESLMQARILCSGECNIRVDLLLIVPILLVITLAAITTGIRTARRSAQAGPK